MADSPLTSRLSLSSNSRVTVMSYQDRQKNLSFFPTFVVVDKNKNCIKNLSSTVLSKNIKLSKSFFLSKFNQMIRNNFCVECLH